MFNKKLDVSDIIIEECCFDRIEKHDKQEKQEKYEKFEKDKDRINVQPTHIESRSKLAFVFIDLPKLMTKRILNVLFNLMLSIIKLILCVIHVKIIFFIILVYKIVHYYLIFLYQKISY
jgi:hypothetical protein